MRPFGLRIRLLSVVLSVFSLVSLLMVLSATAHAWGLRGRLSDTVHLSTGETLKGTLQQVVGDWIFFKPQKGVRTTLSRMTLASPVDRITTDVKGYTSVLEGEIIYSDWTRVEIRTANGLEKILKYYIKSIELGHTDTRGEAPRLGMESSQF